MNTPEPCCGCELLYYNVMTEDDPNDMSDECKLGRTVGDVTCPYVGKDNAGKPKSDYINRLRDMSDEELLKEMKDKIWLSAYAANNQRSDYHWQCDATYAVGIKRGKPELYKQAHAEVSAR